MVDEMALRRQAIELARADARWGDTASALEWLAVAERIAGPLPDALRQERAAWRRQLTPVSPGAGSP
jgi:hypothetical protein